MSRNGTLGIRQAALAVRLRSTLGHMGTAVLGSSSARRRRRGLGLVLLLGVLTGPACGDGSADTGATCENKPSKVVRERPVDVAYRGPSNATALTAFPNLVVQVTNSQPSVERVRLKFDG
ncbi:MAG: hypothetical protein ABI239_04655, partial [Aquihabitans sp.]